MRLNVMNPFNFSRKGRLIALFAIVLFCIFLFTACTWLNSDPNGSVSVPIGESVSDGNDTFKDGNGPTMIMSYSKNEVVKNPIASFMYFIPLIAPTLVDNVSSVNNEQQVAVISHKITSDSKSFHVVCEFEILGSGFHMNTFDPAGMIAAHTGELKRGETLTNMLDYIKFDGNGYGIIEVKGQINDSNRTVTEVDMLFNAGGHKSPVTIGLYDIEPKDGEYKYENRSNQIFARVNSLIFKKTEKTPHMEIKVASVSDRAAPDGFFSSIKGLMANLFIKPPKVNKFGNTMMLEFGNALLEKKNTFTFPKAKNIKESKVIEIDNIQK